MAIGRLLRAALAVLGVAGIVAAAPAQAAYPGENGALAFTSTQDGGARHIFLSRPGGIVDLTGVGSPAAETQPAFSPDGRSIAFTRSEASNGQIFVMSASGRRRRQLTETPTGNTDPTWSPDGRWIAFVSWRDGEPDIYAMRADGTRVRRLTRSADAESDLAWSPRGNRIAFALQPAGGSDTDIYSIHPDGSGLRNLTPDPLDPEVQPDYSPDGMTIVYSGPPHATGSVGGDLWVVNANGGDARPLPHQANGYSDGSYPAFSPDGTTIAFAANGGTGYQHLWAVPAGGGQNSELVANAVAGGNPVDQEVDWQPIVPRAEIEAARIDQRHRRAEFRIHTSGPTSGVRCSLRRGGAAWRFRPCHSPATYRGLQPGRYTFAAIAVGAHGAQPLPTTRRFQIRRSRRGSAGA